jgi:predicted CopG family antitoxin
MVLGLMQSYYDVISEEASRKKKKNRVPINEGLLRYLREGMRLRNCGFMRGVIGAVLLFERDRIEISQPVWQLAYMCLVYCIEFLKETGETEVIDRYLERKRIHILAKLTPTIASKKITKFIRSAADRIKAAKIIQRHYKEYLYKPDVYLKSEISKPARTRFHKV